MSFTSFSIYNFHKNIFCLPYSHFSLHSSDLVNTIFFPAETLLSTVSMERWVFFFFRVKTFRRKRQLSRIFVLMLAWCSSRLNGVNLLSSIFSIPSFPFFYFSGQQHKVQCSEDVMKVLVALPESNTRVYLEGLNGYKNEKCEPKIEDNLAVFELSLINFYDCGIIRVVNKLTVSGGVRLICFGFQ